MESLTPAAVGALFWTGVPQHTWLREALSSQIGRHWTISSRFVQVIGPFFITIVIPTSAAPEIPESPEVHNACRRKPRENDGKGARVFTVCSALETQSDKRNHERRFGFAEFLKDLLIQLPWCADVCVSHEAGPQWKKSFPDKVKTPEAIQMCRLLLCSSTLVKNRM